MKLKKSFTAAAAVCLAMGLTTAGLAQAATTLERTPEAAPTVATPEATPERTFMFTPEDGGTPIPVVIEESGPLIPAFSDTANYPFAEDIDWAAKAKIATGWPDGTFRPTDATNREATVVFLYRLINHGKTPQAVKGDCFKDIAASPFKQEICWMKANGYVNGWSDGTFRPYEPVSREALAAFVARTVRAPIYPYYSDWAKQGYIPDASGSSFYNEIIWVNAQGLIRGWEDDGTFRPYLPAERGAVMAILHRVATADPETIKLPLMNPDLSKNDSGTRYLDMPAGN